MNSARLQVTPEAIQFRDDGKIPNSILPLLLYRGAFEEWEEDVAAVIQSRFAQNGWTGAWRDGVYDFHHYHSTTHEVLGISKGTATLLLGGEAGEKLHIRMGDVLVIPAGVGHKCLDCSADFQVVGAYPGGHRWDVLRGLPGERPGADRNIAQVPLPRADPLYGEQGHLGRLWTPASDGA